MSIRNLDSLFAPSSVVVFGASPRPASVGGTVWCNLHAGGFTGPILAVNPKYRSLFLLCHKIGFALARPQQGHCRG